MATADPPVPALRGRANLTAGQRQLPGGPGLPEDVQPRLPNRAPLERRVHVALGQGTLHQVRRLRRARFRQHRLVRQRQGLQPVRGSVGRGQGQPEGLHVAGQ